MAVSAVDAREVFGKAKWIWIQPQGYDLFNCFMQARRVFSLDRAPRRAKIRITADSRYRLYVNGRHVCRGPARGFQETWPYDEVDIARFLRKGNNVIAALVHSYGCTTNQYIPLDAAGLIIQGKAARTDISTGPRWRVRYSPGHKRHMTRLSRELGFVEIFDARCDGGEWLKVSYDDSEWREPYLTAAGAMPWHFVEERGMPLLDEHVVAPRAVVAQAGGKCANGWDGAENLTANYLAEKREWKAGDAGLRRAKTAGGFEIPAAGAHRFAAVLVDFGEEVVGSVGIEVSGAAGGEVIDWQAAETLTGLTPDVITPFTGCNVALCNRLTLAAGTTSFEQFEPWGFRYLAVIARGNRRPLKVRLHLRTTLYPLDIKASFRCSDARLNDIWNISVRAQECCSLDAFVDCPWREQAQWWGDARVQGANTFHLSADVTLFERGIRQTARQETPEGLTYGLTPANQHHCILPDYTLTWIMTLWDWYWQTGETGLLEKYAERAWRALGYFCKMTDETGLIPYDERYWLFLDWADVFKDGYPTVYNIMYFQALVTAAEIFRLAGRKDYSTECGRRAESLRDAITANLYDRSRRCFHGGLDWKGRPVSLEDPHSYAVAVLSDVLPEESARFAADKLLPLIAGENPKITGERRGLPYEPAVVPSPFFMYYVFEALKKHGYRAEVLECVKRWYGVFIDWGFTTTGENWIHRKGATSACHAWSAHPIVHFADIVLGIRRSAPGWTRIDYRPLLRTPGSASGSVATPLGLVESSWRAGGGAAEVSLTLPEGSAADVTLPGVRETAGPGTHSWTVSAD